MGTWVARKLKQVTNKGKLVVALLGPFKDRAILSGHKCDFLVCVCVEGDLYTEKAYLSTSF